jgi:hypothetical protein
MTRGTSGGGRCPAQVGWITRLFALKGQIRWKFMLFMGTALTQQSVDYHGILYLSSRMKFCRPLIVEGR